MKSAQSVEDIELQCSTPIVFVVFNRPELTRKVFERIASVRPSQLLIVADGARDSKPDEAEVCAQVREIATRVDWLCEVQTNFAIKNLGCRRRLISGLNWAFDQVDRAIILEDDVLPDASFFYFCQEMLGRYAEDTRISMIAGFAPVPEPLRTEDSYYFSKLTHVWGWASWRRAWKGYDEQLVEWPRIKHSGLMKELFIDRKHRAYWTSIFDQMHAGVGPNTWDFQWAYTNFMNSSMAIVPRVNLVENLGFGPLATHTTQARDAPTLSAGNLRFPLVHPPTMVALRSVDHLDQELSGFQSPSKVRQLARRSKVLLGNRFRQKP